MKFIIHLAVLILAFSLIPEKASAQNIGDLYREGLQLYNQGNFLEAKLKFDAIVQKNPRHPARAYAYRCDQAIARGGGKNRIEAQLDKVILPSVSFQDVPLGDAIEYIRQRTQEITSGKVTPNIIFSGTAEQKQTSLITMKLNSIPVTTLLKYIASQTKCKVSYDQYAVTLTPSGGAAAVAAPANKGAAESNPFGKSATPIPFDN